MRFKLMDFGDQTSTGNSTDLVIVIKNHVQALKAVLLVVLLILTLLASLAPFSLRRAALYAKNERRRQIFVLAFSHLSCFGGGVFLATCLLDLLPDTREVLEQAFANQAFANKKFSTFPLAEFLTAFGFFLVLFSEQIFMWFKEMNESCSIGRNIKVHSEMLDASRPSSRLKKVGFLENLKADANHTRLHQPPNFRHTDLTSDLFSDQVRDDFGQISDRLADNLSLIDYTAEIAQDIHFDPEAHSTSRTLLLLAALSLHSLFEGLALGLQHESGVALQIFTALCIHKSIIAFSIGLQLVQLKLTNHKVAMCCTLFSIATPVGGTLGLAIEGMSRSSSVHLFNGCMQGVACGTFLYITSFEILPHELNEVGHAHKFHRLSKLLALIGGFAAICLFVMIWP